MKTYRPALESNGHGSEFIKSALYLLEIDNKSFFLDVWTGRPLGSSSIAMYQMYE